MPSEAKRGELAADLLRELKARGIRGAYARRLVAEWTDHFRNLDEAMPETEAMFRLGTPPALAQAAAVERFDRRWWWRFPIAAGILGGLLTYVVTMGWVFLPVLASLNGWLSLTPSSWYATVFNWAGPLLIFLLVFWMSDNFSSPPSFRRWMLMVLGVLLAFTIMEIQLPEGYVPGSGTGSFSLGFTVSPGTENLSVSMASWLLACRLVLLIGLFVWSRRSIVSVN